MGRTVCKAFVLEQVNYRLTQEDFKIIEVVLNWIDLHSGALTVLCTLIYVIATIFICVYNKRSANAAQTALQKSMDLQMYDRMLSIASNIEQNNYSNSTMEITLLFGTSVWQQVERIKSLSDALNIWEKKRQRYWELCYKYGYDDMLDANASRENAPQEVIDAANRQKKFFAIIDEERSDSEVDPEEYNHDEILSSISLLKNEITTLQKQLKNNIYTILKSKITTD